MAARGLNLLLMGLKIEGETKSQQLWEPLGSGKDKKADSSLEPPEGMWPDRYLDFSP